MLAFSNLGGIVFAEDIDSSPGEISEEYYGESFVSDLEEPIEEPDFIIEDESSEEAWEEDQFIYGDSEDVLTDEISSGDLEDR